MDWRAIKENWASYRVEAQRIWPKLSEEELEQVAGDRTVLIEKLRDHYGRATDEAALEVDRWADTLTEHAE